MKLNSNFIRYLKSRIMQFPMGLPRFLDQVYEVIITGFVVIIQQEMAQLLGWTVVYFQQHEYSSLLKLTLNCCCLRLDRCIKNMHFYLEEPFAWQLCLLLACETRHVQLRVQWNIANQWSWVV